MRIKNILKKANIAVIASIVAVIGLGAVHTSAAPVATANTLKVSPVRTDLNLDPGEKKVLKITVTNPTDKKVAVKPIQNDFIAEGEDGTPALILDEKEYAPKHSLKRFLKPLKSFNIDANSSKTIDVVIEVPKNAEAGGHFGAIRFAPTDPDEGGQVNMSASVASIVLLRVNGDAPEKLDLTDFRIMQGGKEGSFFTGSETPDLVIRFKNGSPVQLAPFGKISIQNGDKVVNEIDFNNKNQKDMILPDSARKWQVPLEKVEGFGHYTVSATFTYGVSNQTIEVSKKFWVVPMSLILIVVSILVVIIALVAAWILRKRYGGRSMSLGSSRRR